ncbi:MAG TPA: L-threonylcarbamoyladenylate synthase [Candidatus Saccharibacteria bacterium]|nr:L-threonylcarbamoyladenylate synthase [Candidatus Saccharibacteria bacterium]
MAQLFTSLADPQLHAAIAEGKIGVIPTDTVYGLVCCAKDEQSVQRLFQTKLRDEKPGTIIAASIDQLEALGLKRRYLTADNSFWPGPVSVIVPCADAALAYLHRGKQSLAVRLPEAPSLQTMLEQVGPLLTTSANMPTQPTAQTIDSAQQYFGDMIDFYVDGGDLSGRPPSTIIRIIDDAIEVVREGAVKINEAGRIEL